MEPLDEVLKSLVDQMPDPDKKGMYSVVDKEKVDKAVTEIGKLAPDGLVALIDLLAEPGTGDDFKARYTLHCVALDTCKLESEGGSQQLFAQTLAQQLGTDRPKGVQRCLIQELQAVGGVEVVETLGKLLTDEALCEPAAQALVAIGSGAAEQFRKALPTVKGSCRLTVVQNLGVVRDAESADALKPMLADTDLAIRQAAAWALANIGDASSVDVVIKYAEGSQGWEKIKATKARLLLAERLEAAGKKAEAKRLRNIE